MFDFQLGQTIYAPTKTGNVKTWCCDVLAGDDPDIGNPATLVIITRTKLDGKPVRREDYIQEGKNLGKSNETTPYQQAISEAESRYRKKIKEGYQDEIPTDTSKANCNALGFPKPMLAHPIDKVKEVEFPAHFQPKLDGHRAIVTKKDGEMVMYSRKGDPITSMRHILRHLEDKVDEGMFLDGELYIHGRQLQDIGSLIRREQPGSEEVVYHIYDMISEADYTQRWEELRIIVGECPLGPARLVPTFITRSMGEAQIFTDDAINEGYEGGIVRAGNDGGYLAGFRSRKLLKVKKFDDSEHTIVDVVEGKDRIVNDVDLKVACFVCETPEGQRFEVTAMGDMYEKDRTWHNREDFKGKTLTVKHSGYTKDRKPWHPVALRLREDI